MFGVKARHAKNMHTPICSVSGFCCRSCRVAHQIWSCQWVQCVCGVAYHEYFKSFANMAVFGLTRRRQVCDLAACIVNWGFGSLGFEVNLSHMFVNVLINCTCT